MSQQDAAKQQANTRNNIRVVSIFTAAAIGLVGVLVILYAWQLPPFTRHSQFTDNAYVRGQTTFISPQVNGYITAVNVKDFAIVQPGEVLFQIDDRIYKQRVHQAQATLAMKEAALRNNLQQRKSAEATIAKNEAALQMLRGKSFDITGKRRNLTGIRGITGFTLFGYLIPVKEKLSRSAKLLILLLKSLHWSKGGVQNQFYHTSK